MLLTSMLENGVAVISRAMPNTRSAALGVWLVNGVRHQGPDQSGYAHLLEHLLFKDTERHDALALAQRFEAMGGQVNAHTGRELTALHGLVPAAQLCELLELFSTMLLQARFDERDLEVEREVILQEMAMVEDTPEEALEDYAVERVWPGHPMGRTILGEPGALAGARATDVHRYLHGILRGGRIRVVACGAVDHQALVQACAPLAALPAGDIPKQAAPDFVAGTHTRVHATTQTHLLWLLPVPPPTDPDYAALVMANHVLGGGVSSRLFQELRERRGLVYGVQSHLDLLSDAGLWLVHTSCEPDRAGACRRAVETTVRELLDGPTAQELTHTRAHMRASLLIEEDDPEASMERIAREYIQLGRVVSLEERLEQLTAVDTTDIARVLAAAWERRAEARWGPA